MLWTKVASALQGLILRMILDHSFRFIFSKSISLIHSAAVFTSVFLRNPVNIIEFEVSSFLLLAVERSCENV